MQRAFADSVDANGVIAWANRVELDMLGYTCGEYIGHRIGEFYVVRRDAARCTIVPRVSVRCSSRIAIRIGLANYRIEHDVLNRRATNCSGRFSMFPLYFSHW